MVKFEEPCRTEFILYLKGYGSFVVSGLFLLTRVYGGSIIVAPQCCGETEEVLCLNMRV